MPLKIPSDVLAQIHAHLAAAYPEEGVGLLLGRTDGDRNVVNDVMLLQNVREPSARRDRYLVSPEDTLLAHEEAERRELDVIGAFHSHPDQSCQPSEIDFEWAVPWFSYVIISVHEGRVTESRCWRLAEDRSRFEEQRLLVLEQME